MKNSLRFLMLLLWILPIGMMAQENTALTCADGIDNDGDGMIDCDDGDCATLSNDGCSTCLEDGLSFADYVISYNPICPNIEAENLVPEFALGASDWSTTANDVSLGEGGSISLGFSNNLVVNSGNNAPDVWVFEVGPQVEASTLELRPVNDSTINILIAEGIEDSDNNGFYDFGSISGSTASLDIDSKLANVYPFASLKFDAIKITDIPGNCVGNTPGADIDAVCALSSFTCTTRLTELSATICLGDVFEGYTNGGFFVDTLTAQDGCDSIRTIDLTVSIPAPQIFGDTVSCAGDTINLTATGGTTYEWSTGATGSSISFVADSSQQISVSVVNDQGCMASALIDLIVLPSPDARISGNDRLCVGSTSTYTVPISSPGSHDFMWSNGNGTSSFTFFRPEVSSELSVTVTNSSGCSSVASKFVEVLPRPIVDIVGDSTSCEGDSLTLQAQSPTAVTFDWSTDDSTQVISVVLDQSAFISVTVRDSNNCRQSDTIDIEVLSNPSVMIMGNEPICAGSPLQLAASSSDVKEFAWSTGEDGPIILIAPENTTEYSIEVTASNGCTAADTVVVEVNALPIINFSLDQDTLCINDTAQLNAMPMGGVFSGVGVMGDQFIGNLAGEGLHPIVYEFTDSLGCLNQDSVDIFVIKEGCITSVKELSMEEVGLSISPNPFVDYLQIELENPSLNDNIILQIYDLVGKAQYREQLSSTQTPIQVALPGLTPGIYLVQIQWQGQVYSSKMIKH